MQQETKEIKFNIAYMDLLQEDERFAIVNIGVMHDGMNKNDLFFPTEVMKQAEKTIYNIPIGILYNIFKNDATDHLAKGEDKTKQHNVGTIPETNEIRYIEKDGRTYMEVYGVIWKHDCPEAYEILKKRVLNQSMEALLVKYHMSEEGFLIVDEFKFTRIQLLSQDTTPAMEDARVELLMQYSAKERDLIKESNELIKRCYSVGAKDKEDIVEEEIKKEDMAENEEVQEDPIAESAIEAENAKEEQVENMEEEEAEKEQCTEDTEMSELKNSLIEKDAEIESLKLLNASLQSERDALFAFKQEIESKEAQEQIVKTVNSEIKEWSTYLSEDNKKGILSMVNSETKVEDIITIKNHIHELAKANIDNQIIMSKENDEGEFKTYSIMQPQVVIEEPTTAIGRLAQFVQQKKESERV